MLIFKPQLFVALIGLSGRVVCVKENMCVTSRQAGLLQRFHCLKIGGLAAGDSPVDAADANPEIIIELMPDIVSHKLNHTLNLDGGDSGVQ